MRILRNVLSICLIFILCSCFNSKSKSAQEAFKKGKISISKNDMAFSIEELKKEPGEEVSFDLLNGLVAEKLRFYLLKDGEDPIVVQHIKAQQGGVPDDYYIFESSDIEPGEELKISFKAPEKEGIYAFVGVGDVPRETLVGRLIVEKKMVTTAGQSEIKDVN